MVRTAGGDLTLDYLSTKPGQESSTTPVSGSDKRRVPIYARRLVEPVLPGPPRPDLPALFDAAGLVDIAESTVTRAFELNTFDDWWTWTLSHGHRIFLDGLSEPDRDEFKRDAKDRMESLRTASGYEMEWTTQIVVGRKGPDDTSR